MRKIFSAVLAAGLLTSQMAAAQCARPADTVAFDVVGLKTNLMVTALTCNADERYNAFVTKYRPELVNHDKMLGSYFSRVHGRQARVRQDDYVTQLANSQSQVGIRQGSTFCNRNLPTFNEVMALRSGRYVQGYGRLHREWGTGDEEFCCLGVLSHISPVIPKKYTGEDVSVFSYGNNTMSLSESVRDWAGIRADDPPVQLHDESTSLAVLNDSGDYSLAEIADVIEQ